jgi:hypothetical protein
LALIKTKQMIRKLSVLNIIIVLSLIGCGSMKIKEKIEKKLQPLPLSERIVVIEENENITIGNGDIKIGIFEIKDGGLPPAGASVHACVYTSTSKDARASDGCTCKIKC